MTEIAKKFMCRCDEFGCCCYCGKTLRHYTYIPMRELDGHLFCIECYPRACDVYIADQKLKKFREER